MSKVYIVSYDLMGSENDYEELFSTLTSFPAWWHFLASTWLVVTDLNAVSVFEKLRPYIDDKANILVMEAGSDCAGWLPNKAWEWIRAQRATNGRPVSHSTVEASSL